jgi:hypothetical protein
MTGQVREEKEVEQTEQISESQTTEPKREGYPPVVVPPEGVEQGNRYDDIELEIS